MKKHKKICLFILSWTIASSPLSAQLLTLRQAIDLALTHNRTILFNAKESYASSRAGLAMTQAAYDYHVDFSISSTHDYSKASFPASAETKVSTSQIWFPNLNMNRTWLTPLGGRTTAGLGLNTQITSMPYRAYQFAPQFTLSFQQPLSLNGMRAGHQDIVNARANFQSAELGFELQREQLLVTVINGYYQLWQAQKNIERAQREQESARRVLQIAELRLQAKSLAESEVLNSRVQVVSAEDNFAVAENQLQNHQRNFAQLLGQDIARTAFILVDSIVVDTLGISLDEAISQALQNRREIRQAEIDLELSKLGVVATASSNDPVLNLSGRYNLASSQDPSFNRALRNFPFSGWNVQASVAIPLMDGGAAKSRLELAQRTCSIQQNNLYLLRENIPLEVEQIWRGLKLDERRIATLGLNLQLAEEALDIVELRFQHGQISSNEVEQVRSRYLATQESLNGARVSYKIQSAELARATGRLREWVERQE